MSRHPCRRRWSDIHRRDQAPPVAPAISSMMACAAARGSSCSGDRAPDDEVIGTGAGPPSPGVITPLLITRIRPGGTNPRRHDQALRTKRPTNGTDFLR